MKHTHRDPLITATVFNFDTNFCNINTRELWYRGELSSYRHYYSVASFFIDFIQIHYCFSPFDLTNTPISFIASYKFRNVDNNRISNKHADDLFDYWKNMKHKLKQLHIKKGDIVHSKQVFLKLKELDIKHLLIPYENYNK